MSAEERLLVLEQLVASMKGEVIAALIAAARVEQRATNARVFGVRGEGVVDTRLLGATGPRTVGDSSIFWATLAQSTQNSNRRHRERSAAGGIDHELSCASVVLHEVLLLDGSAQRLLDHWVFRHRPIPWRVTYFSLILSFRKGNPIFVHISLAILHVLV